MASQSRKSSIRRILTKDRVDTAQSLGGICHVGDVITSNISTAGAFVGVGNIIRIQVAADTYVAFGDAAIGAVTVATTPAIKLAAGYHYILASDDYIRASGVAVRLEVILS